MRPIALIAGSAALALAAFDAVAQTATQFDLVCSGTRQSSINGPVEPHEYRLRIDLEAERWCWNECPRTMPIVEIAPDQLTLLSERVDTDRTRSTHENTVSRVTGEHRAIWIESRPFPTFVETKGQCEAADFSGFPAARF